MINFHDYLFLIGNLILMNFERLQDVIKGSNNYYKIKVL